MQGKFWYVLEKGKDDGYSLLVDTIYSSVLQSFIGKGRMLDRMQVESE